MNDNKKNNHFVILYFALGLCGTSLLFTGLFLEQIFAFFSVKLPETILHIFQIIFILSALFNFWVVKYAHNKLS